MKSAWMLVVVLLLLVSSSPRRYTAARPYPGDDQLEAVKPEEQEIRAATPEDPGPIATVVQPLAILKAQGKCAQSNPAATPAQKPLKIDHPLYAAAQQPKNFLHKVFQVSNRAQFMFLVPAHQGNTRLRGTFRSFTKRSDPDSTSDRTAALDVLLLNEEEFNEFLHGPPRSVTYELDSANNQTVDWWVPTTYGESQTYHLVFSNSAGGAKIKFVEADFTVSFE